MRRSASLSEHTQDATAPREQEQEREREQEQELERERELELELEWELELELEWERELELELERERELEREQEREQKLMTLLEQLYVALRASPCACQLDTTWKQGRRLRVHHCSRCIAVERYEREVKSEERTTGE